MKGREKGKAGESAGFGKGSAIFLAKFFIIYAALQFLILAAPLQGLKEWIAGIEAGALGLESSGATVFLAGHAFEIVANCTGLMGIAVLAAVVFSLRKPGIAKKLQLFALGAVLLFAVNLLRVYFVLLAASLWNPGAAESLHTATWFAMAGIILALWYALTKRIAGAKAFAEMI